VTLGARKSGAHPDLHRGVDTIDDGGVVVLLRVGAAFGIRGRVAVEPRGDDLLGRRVRQQVAGEHLSRKAIVGRVVIERANEPVPPAPDRARWIVNVASGIAGYPWRRFLLWDVRGEVLWVVLYVCIGYAFSNRVQAIAEILGNLTWVVVGLIVAVILGWQLVRYVQAQSEPTTE